MKALITTIAGKSYAKRALEKQQIADTLASMGSPRRPAPPRDLTLQDGPTGVLFTWKLPAQFADIVGWNVYKNTESELFQSITDRDTRQAFVPVSTDATTPPKVSIFVSSVNAAGVESPKVQIIGQAAIQSGVPSVPSSPPGWAQEQAGGGNRRAGFSGPGRPL